MRPFASVRQPLPLQLTTTRNLLLRCTSFVMGRKSALRSALSFLQDSQLGYCAGRRAPEMKMPATMPATAQPASCVGESGSFSLNSSSTSSWILAVSVCLSYCRSRPRCASISVSHKHDDCRWMRWFSTEVDIKHLHIPEARWRTTALTQDGQGYRSGPLVARNSSVQHLDRPRRPQSHTLTRFTLTRFTPRFTP